MLDAQKKMFETAYRTGTDIWTHIPYEKAQKEFTEKLSPNALVLDVGAGRGLFATLLVQSGMRVIGLEYVDEQTQKNNAEVKNKGWESRARFVTGDALDIPFTDASFDAVTDIGLAQHLPAESMPLYLTEVARVLKPGGFFLMTELSKETVVFFDWHPKASENGLFAKDDYLYHFFSEQELRTLTAAQFEILSAQIESVGDRDPVLYQHMLLKKKI